jgi:hypothetical protein
MPALEEAPSDARSGCVTDEAEASGTAAARAAVDETSHGANRKLTVPEYYAALAKERAADAMRAARDEDHGVGTSPTPAPQRAPLRVDDTQDVSPRASQLESGEVRVDARASTREASSAVEITNSTEDVEEIGRWQEHRLATVERPWWPSDDHIAACRRYRPAGGMILPFDCNGIIAAVDLERRSSPEERTPGFWLERFFRHRFFNKRSNLEGQLSSTAQAWQAFADNVSKGVGTWLAKYHLKHDEFVARAPRGAMMDVHYASIGCNVFCAVPRRFTCPLCHPGEQRLEDTADCDEAIRFERKPWMPERLVLALDNLRRVLARNPRKSSPSRAPTMGARARIAELRPASPREEHRAPPTYRGLADTPANAHDTGAEYVSSSSLVDRGDQPGSPHANAAGHSNPSVVAVEVGRPEQLPPSSEELEKLRAALAEERDARLKMEKELASMRQLLDRQHRGLKSQATAIGALKGTTSRLSTTLEATSDELRRLKRKRARTDRGTDEGARRKTSDASEDS